MTTMDLKGILSTQSKHGIFSLTLKLYKNRDTTEVKEQDTLQTNNENSRPIQTTSQTIENST